MVKELNSSNFKEEISKGKVLVKYGADWCAPCKQLDPILEETSEEVEDTKFYKLDVDKNGDIAQQYEIRGIPTLILFNNGNEVKRITGVTSKENLKEQIK